MGRYNESSRTNWGDTMKAAEQASVPLKVSRCHHMGSLLVPVPQCLGTTFLHTVFNRCLWDACSGLYPGEVELKSGFSSPS